MIEYFLEEHASENAWFRELIEHYPDAILLVHESQLLYANQHAKRLLGMSDKQASEYVGSSLYSFFVADDRLALRGYLSLTLEEKEKGSVWCGRLLQDSGRSPIRDVEVRASIQSLGEQKVIQLILNRKKREEVADHQKLSHMIDQPYIVKFIPEPIVLIDGDKLIFVNKLGMQLFGVENSEDVLGNSIYKYIPPAFHFRIKAALRLIMSIDEPTPYSELKLIKVNGQRLEVEISSTRIRNYMGKMVVLSVIRDLTDRKQAAELMVRSEKLSAMGQLAAGVAHEIRNPLTALKGFTQLLQSRVEDFQHYFEIMGNEIDRINLIVNEFMALAKPHFSQFVVTRLEDILQSVVSILETQAIMVSVELLLEVESDLPPIYANENQLKQVFLNVIKNALEAMPSGGRVDVNARLCVKDKMLMVLIRDYGIGMSDELLKKVGEPFLTTKDKGTGLGLMISNRIIEEHRGRLNIDSIAGKGTTVTITLPIHTGGNSQMDR